MMIKRRHPRHPGQQLCKMRQKELQEPESQSGASAACHSDQRKKLRGFTQSFLDRAFADRSRQIKRFLDGLPFGGAIRSMARDAIAHFVVACALFRPRRGDVEPRRREVEIQEQAPHQATTEWLAS